MSRRYDRYAAGITYATLHTALDQAARDVFALGYARTAKLHCALCQCAPCRCPAFGTPAYFALLDQRHGRAGDAR